MGRTSQPSSRVYPVASARSNSLLRAIARPLQRFRVVWVMLLTSLLLSGCVHYDVGVNFDSPNRGEIVQHLQLGDRLSGTSSQQWLDTLERRTRQLGGKTRRDDSQGITVTIPFSSGTELNQKFNDFFQPPTAKEIAKKSDLALPKIPSDFKLGQSNFLLLLRNQLSYTLDLRSLGGVSANGNLLVNPGSLIDLEFRLNTPWGARSITTSADSIAATSLQQGHQLVWKLQPGQVNHLEAVFWMPSPLGIGTVVIVLLAIAGFYFKYKTLPFKNSRPSTSS
jgi:hypothetical protein